jgi:hypothetical protein
LGVQVHVAVAVAVNDHVNVNVDVNVNVNAHTFLRYAYPNRIAISGRRAAFARRRRRTANAR